MDKYVKTEGDIVVSTYTSLHVSSDFLHEVTEYMEESEQKTPGASLVLQSTSMDWETLSRIPGSCSRLDYYCTNTATLLRVL